MTDLHATQGQPSFTQRSVSYGFVDAARRNDACKLALISLALIYPWVLPALAGISWKDIEKEPHPVVGLRFANMCNGYPKCVNSPIGISVSSYIASPMATGVMAGVFFWPLFHLFSLRDHIEHAMPRFGILLMTMLQLCFGAFLAAPVTDYPAAHFSVVIVFTSAGMILFVGMFRHTQNEATILVKTIIILSIASFFGIWIVVVISAILPPNWLRENGFFWSFYVLEAMGLSFMSLYPWLWEVRDEAWYAPSFHPTESERQSASRKFLKIAIPILPVIYIWSLPLLAMPGVDFAYRCPGYPVCDDGRLGVFVFLGKTASTGAMGAVMFWPLAHIWSSRRVHASRAGDEQPLQSALLHGGLVCFFLILSIPVRVHKKANSICTILYCLCTIAYFALILRRDIRTWRCRTQAMLFASVACLICELPLLVLDVCWPGVGMRFTQTVPYFNFCLEATGLSLMALLAWGTVPEDQASSQRFLDGCAPDEVNRTHPEHHPAFGHDVQHT